MSTLAAAGAQDAAVIQNDVSAPADGDGAARVGDMLDPDGVPAQPTASTVREKLPNGDGDSKESAEPSKPSSTPNPKRAWPTALAWIPKNWTWASARTVLRCSLMGWTSLVLLMIGRLERAMGIVRLIRAGRNRLLTCLRRASLSSSPLSSLLPQSRSWSSSSERCSSFSSQLPAGRTYRSALTASLASRAMRSWSCLAIKLASLARTRFVPKAPQTLIFSGEFIETGPTVIFAVFLFFGTAFFLYMKARMGPGPYTFASVFGCICLGEPAHSPTAISLSSYVGSDQSLHGPLLPLRILRGTSSPPSAADPHVDTADRSAKLLSYPSHCTRHLRLQPPHSSSLFLCLRSF
jgi:hypothetical protein